MLPETKGMESYAVRIVLVHHIAISINESIAWLSSEGLLLAVDGN